jgi:hypothetical protein
MDLAQTSINQRRGREAARPGAGLAGYPAASASRVAAAAMPPGIRMRQNASAGPRPVAPMAGRITALVILGRIGNTHPGVPL